MSNQRAHLVIRCLVLVAVVTVSLAASAQSCALCYTQAAGAGSKVIAALKSGILVLIFPPFLICTVLTVAGYRKRNSYAHAPIDSGDNDLGW